MSRRRPNSDPYRAPAAQLALDELCGRFGYCLPPDDQQAIIDNPPADADAFVDAVVSGEGLHPDAMTKQDRRPIVEMVERLVYHDDNRRWGPDLSRIIPRRRAELAVWWVAKASGVA